MVANKRSMAQWVTWAGIILIVITGVIHFVEAPDNFEEATYKGVLFILNGLGALVAAFGIYRGARSWGWTLGLLVAGGAFVMYIISRTVGLPGLEVDDDWFEPTGVLAMVVEGVFVAVYVYAMVLLKQKSILSDQRQARQ